LNYLTKKNVQQKSSSTKVRYCRRKTGNLSLFLFFSMLLAIVLLGGCTGSKKDQKETTKKSKKSASPPIELHVSAATTLKDAFEQLAPSFEKENNVKIVLNFAASGVLQKQIEGGASVDVFASASPKQVDALVASDFIAADAPSVFAGNSLVIIVSKGNPSGIEGPDDLSKAKRLTTGNPETAPHGTKAKEWLEGLGLWNTLQPKFVFAENAAQTLDYVSRGEVDAGLNFANEANGRNDIEVVYTAPKNEIKPIKYVVAPLKDSKQSAVAKKFIDFLASSKAQKILVENGFLKASKE